MLRVEIVYDIKIVARNTRGNILTTRIDNYWYNLIVEKENGENTYVSQNENC